MSSATQRLQSKEQTLADAYSPPANFLEIDVCNPQIHGEAGNRYVDYEVKMKTNLPVFQFSESSVRRRYRDFDWLRCELDRESKIIVPKLPGKAWKRMLPLRADDGLFDRDFIETRRRGLEEFINKVAGHPLVQNEKCLHMFLQSDLIDRNYKSGRINIS
nr:sorting nexin [Hymenolepis microstoma]